MQRNKKKKKKTLKKHKVPPEQNRHGAVSKYKTTKVKTTTTKAQVKIKKIERTPQKQYSEETT